MTKRWLTILLAIGALLLLCTPVALADGDPPDGGVVIWNEDYTLEEGQSLDNDLIVFNGDVTLEAGSRVEGSVIVWNGSAEVAGIVQGDLVVSGGDIHLDSAAHVKGQVVCSWNCALEREEGARVDGGIVEGIPAPAMPSGRWGRFPIPHPFALWASASGQAMGWAFRVVRSIAAVLVVAFVAALVALVWPNQMTQVGRTLSVAPWASFGVGVVVTLVGLCCAVASLLTICLPPLILLALGAMGLFGWIAVGALLGEQMARLFNLRSPSPVWTAGLGVLLLALLIALLNTFFCLALFGWLLVLILGCLGLGAVALTRFGTQAYPPESLLPTPCDLGG